MSSLLPTSTLFPYTTLFRSPTGAIVLIGLGVFFLLNNFGLLHIGRMWPILLIGLGLWIAFKRTAGFNRIDRKSTRLNSSHRCISYAVFCLKKKKKYVHQPQD